MSQFKVYISAFQNFTPFLDAEGTINKANPKNLLLHLKTRKHFEISVTRATVLHSNWSF